MATSSSGLPQQETPTTTSTRRIGSFGGTNTARKRRKLKGLGILPEFPELTSYHLQTVGCQMNVADSERLEGVLQSDALQLTAAANPADAQLIVFNTCSIRDHAQQKLYDAVGPFAAQKRAGTRRLALVVTGCVAQQEGRALAERIPEVDVVLGPQYIPHLANILHQVAAGQLQMVLTQPTLIPEVATTATATSGRRSGGLQPQALLGTSTSRTTTTTAAANTASSISPVLLDNDNDLLLANDSAAAGTTAQPVRGHAVRAWVNVIYGCNEHCTYCVVPGTRGMEVSRTMEAILQECTDLAAAGYREITLLGQNIDAYGRDMVPKRTFGDLLHYLNANVPDPVVRIRYVTSHPRYFSDRVIAAVAHLPKVCECFHMPFQSGNDAVLRGMRRGYTRKSYLQIIDKIRAAAPDAAICADVIVGFPGETEQAFEETLQLMEYVKFDNLNSFAYSPRPNTEAALWNEKDDNIMIVDEATKAERLQRLQRLAARHGLERSRRYVGRVVEVLMEDANPRNPLRSVMGRTRQGRQVYLTGQLDELQGQLVHVLITEARTWSLVGEIVSSNDGTDGTDDDCC